MKLIYQDFGCILQLLDIWMLFFLLMNAVFTAIDCWVDYEYRKEIMERKKAILEVRQNNFTTAQIVSNAFFQNSDLNKSDLAALGHEEPQICWEEEIPLAKTEEEKGADTVLEGENDVIGETKQQKVEHEVVEDMKDGEAQPPKPEDNEVKPSGTSAVLYAAFYEDWTSKTGKVFTSCHFQKQIFKYSFCELINQAERINNAVKIAVPIVTIIFIIVFSVVAAVGSSSASNH